jgi:hypothetical protein
MSNCRWKLKLDRDFRFQTREGRRLHVLSESGRPAGREASVVRVSVVRVLTLGS